jgi:hypothetical protein
VLVTDLDWVQGAVEQGSSIRGSCSFVGGSSARGWANPRSDVDVYVFGCPEDWAEIVWGTDGHPDVDVHALSDARVEDLFARVSWDVVTSGKEFVDTFAERDWLMFERVHHAYVLTGHARLAEYQARLAGSAHRYMLVQEHFAFADARAEDCLGQLAAGDLDSAVLSGQATFFRAVDGLLAAHGCYASSAKWRARAMQEAAPDLVGYDDFWKVVTMAELPAMGREGWSRQRVADARDIMSRVDVLEFTRVVDG